MDTKTFKATNSEGGTLTAQLLAAEVTTLHLTPVPDKAPGTITINAGTAKEEEIFYKTKDAVAGIVSGLTRDYSNLNGGTGRQHENGDPWETLQSVTPLNNLVDAIQDGYIEEIQAVLYVSASSFTVATDRTGYYTAGRMLRINQNGSLIGYVASSSYSAGTGLTTVNTTGVTVPDPITHMEMGIQPKNAPAYSTATKTETLTNKTLTSPTITGTALVSANGLNVSSLYRQALINGNFDVWQRGTSIAMTTANAYTADRWYCETATAGTDKTVSRQDVTGVEGSNYCARVAMVQDVDELLTFSQALESQDSIKLRGKKLTLSFYARGGAEFVADNATLVSKIVTGKGTDQKVLAFTTSADAASQNNTLTTSWQKFTVTTTNVIASDITQVGVSFAFTHAGSGTTTNYFEITQVQLCAGDVALPFQPKSFEEELRACQRYYEPIPHIRAFGTRFSTNDVLFNVPFVAPKRNITWDYTLVGTNGNQFHDGTAQMSGTISVTAITKTTSSAYLQVTGFGSGTDSRAVVGFSSTLTFLAIDNEL